MPSLMSFFPFLEWQQNKEIVEERETRLPHQWPLCALSQLSEGKMFELNHHWLSVQKVVPPHSMRVGTLLKYASSVWIFKVLKA